jgi:hypothetical protein
VNYMPPGRGLQAFAQVSLAIDWQKIHAGAK